MPPRMHNNIARYTRHIKLQREVTFTFIKIRLICSHSSRRSYSPLFHIYVIISYTFISHLCYHIIPLLHFYVISFTFISHLCYHVNYLYFRLISSYHSPLFHINVIMSITFISHLCYHIFHIYVILSYTFISH